MTHRSTSTRSRARLAGGVALAAIIVAGFAWSVHLRSPWFGVLSLRHHQWHTGQTLLATRNWWAEGAWSLKWLWLDEPASVEFPTLESRRIYPSYPPGAAVPIHLLACLRGAEPDVDLIMGWNLAGHLLATLAMATALYLMLLRLGLLPRDAVLLCLPPVAVLLYSPAPMYWLQNTCFADEAVILPYALLLLLEAVRDTSQHDRRGLGALQGMVACWGVFTDWLFCPLILAVCIKRLLLQRHRPARLLPVVCGTAVGAGVFLAQVSSVGLLGTLLHKFAIRSGMGDADMFPVGSFYASFWAGHVARGFGTEAVWLLWAALFATIVALAATRGRTRHAAWWAVLVILPCFAQPYLLANHSRIHSFSALKMALPLAAAYGLLPVLAAAACRVRLARLSRRGRLTVRLLPWLLACGLVLAEPLGRATSLFPSPDPDLHTVGTFLRAHTGASDLVFSDDIRIDTFPPQALSLSMKHVYPTAQMAEVIARVPAGARFRVLRLRATAAASDGHSSRTAGPGGRILRLEELPQDAAH